MDLDFYDRFRNAAKDIDRDKFSNNADAVEIDEVEVPPRDDIEIPGVNKILGVYKIPGVEETPGPTGGA